MSENPVIDMLGRRLRLAVIGGGPGSFIGGMHRAAARLDDRYELVAAALSSDPDRSRDAGLALGLDPERSYGSGPQLMAAEQRRPDGADVVAVMTPNDSHHQLALTALDAGFDLIIDKPITNTLDEALEVLEAVQRNELVCCLTHNYTGYPMVRQARALVAEGMLGEIRLVQVEYVQGGKARPRVFSDTESLPWRYDPVRGGPSLVMGDIGTQAHNLLRFSTGREVAEGLCGIDFEAHRGSKSKVRAECLAALRGAIEAELTGAAGEREAALSVSFELRRRAAGLAR